MEIKKTIRLKKQEASDLQKLAYELTKKAILSNRHKIYTESELVHFFIEYGIKNIDLDEDGKLFIK